jgi:hypothetical protein
LGSSSELTAGGELGISAGYDGGKWATNDDAMLGAKFFVEKTDGLSGQMPDFQNAS